MPRPATGWWRGREIGGAADAVSARREHQALAGRARRAVPDQHAQGQGRHRRTIRRSAIGCCRSRPDLEKRATKQEWWELQQAQLAYQPALAAPKLAWAHFQDEPSFVVDRSGTFLNNKCFFLSTEDDALAALLNSRCLWFQLKSLARPKRGGYVEAEAQYVEALSLPDLSGAETTRLGDAGRRCATAASRRFEVETAVRHRIQSDLAGGSPKWSRRLETWWDLDFAALRDEIRRVFRTDIPVKQRAEWEAFLAEQSAEVRALGADIAATERAIDAIVYRLFGLTPDEIALLEAATAVRS